MKQKQLFIIATMFISMGISVTTNAQTVKGNNYVNAGVGLGTFGFSGTGGLPLAISFEHGLADKISAGLVYGMVHTTFDKDWKYNYYVIGLRGSYHFNEALKVTNPNVDIYGGVTLFYRGYSIKYTGSQTDYLASASAGGLAFAMHCGAHYYFGSSLGGFAELGYGISPLQLGLTFKF
ncbi:MAG: hypothetical protein NVS1B13_08320 [Flavisolibacter sp.]